MVLLIIFSVIIVSLIWTFRPRHLPQGSGPLGLHEENPISVEFINSYLNRLVSKDGKHLELRKEWERRHKIDGWTHKFVVTKGIKKGTEIYLHINGGYSHRTKAPRGFKLLKEQDYNGKSMFGKREYNGFEHPQGYGKFGYSITNPILCPSYHDTIAVKYLLDVLRTNSGEKVALRKKGVYLTENMEQYVEEHVVTKGEKVGVSLYLGSYDLFDKYKAPDGFILVDHEPKKNQRRVEKSQETIEAENFPSHYSIKNEEKIPHSELLNLVKTSEKKNFSTTEINFLDYYHPYRRGTNLNFNSFSKQILKLKDEEDEGIAFFYSRCLTWVDRDFDLIITVPSHDPMKKHSGIRTLANKLTRTKGFTDGTGLLIRKRKIEKLSYGGNRSLEVHLSSLEVLEEGKIYGKRVLLMDDVSTTGNSLLASKEKLIRAGASVVYMCSLAQTLSD